MVSWPVGFRGLTFPARTVAVALLLTLTGCSGDTEPAPDKPSVDEVFADKVRSMVGDMSDAEAVDEAKGFCFEVVRGVKKSSDLNVFINVFVVREIVAPEHAIPFLVYAMKTYCPEMERFRPDRTA